MTRPGPRAVLNLDHCCSDERPASAARSCGAEVERVLRDRDRDVLRRPSAAALHARNSGDEALIVIETGKVFAGSLPGRALRLVREWLDEHRDELMANWDRANAGRPTEPIAPPR
jgi:hypothetical protein